MSRKRKPLLDTPFLDEQERDVVSAIEAAFEKSPVSPPAEDRREFLADVARRTMNPPKKAITTRLAQDDLAKLKARALALGIPYQTLLASIVHRYVDGTLVDADQRDTGA